MQAFTVMKNVRQPAVVVPVPQFAVRPLRRSFIVNAASSSPAPEPPQRKKTFAEVMGFSGYAPEVINGRLAQLGFVAGLGAEIATGESFPAQFAAHWPSFLFATGVVTLATFIPSFNSVTYTADPKTKKEVFGPFSESAEIFNSRAAMIGIAAMLILESVKGGPLITLNAKPQVVPETLTAESIRQQVVQESRSDGFEPKGLTPAAPAESFNPRADPLPQAPSPSEATPAASIAPPAEQASNEPMMERAAIVSQEPVTKEQQIAKLKAELEALREEIEAMEQNPTIASTLI